VVAGSDPLTAGRYLLTCRANTHQLPVDVEAARVNARQIGIEDLLVAIAE